MSQPSIITRIVQTTGDLPSMPHVATQVMEKLGEPETTARELHQIMTQDQALAARVLKVANSPFYGCARTITRLTDAIVVMGFNSIRSLVMTSVMNDMFKSFGLAEKLLWEHSLGCAAAAKKIASAIRFSKVEEAFLAGLMHDIGKVILNLKLPSEMMGILQEVYNTPGLTFAQLEYKAFGFTHAQVGQLIARKWNFAEEIEEAIGAHHWPHKARILPTLCHIVFMANAFCHKLEVGPTHNPDLDLMSLESAEVLKLSAERIETLQQELTEALKSPQGLAPL